MNERLTELAKKHGLDITIDGMGFGEGDIEGLVNSVMQECKENFAKVWYEQGLDIRGAELGKFMTLFDKHFGV